MQTQTKSRVLVALLAVLTVSVGLLGFVAYQLQLQLRSQAANLAEVGKQLKQIDDTLVLQAKVHKEFATQTASEISELRTASQGAIGLVARVDKVEKSFDETKASLLTSTRDLSTQVSVLRVSIQQALSVKLDSSGAVIERAGQRKNGIDLR